MVWTEESVRFLAWNAVWIASLLICAVALFVPRFRQGRHNLKWLIVANLLGGLFHYGQIPVAAAQEWAFRSFAPGYAWAEQPFDGGRLHIPRPDLLATAAYGCHALEVAQGAAGPCPLPVARMLGGGAVTQVDLGEGPVTRLRVLAGPAACAPGDDLPAPLEGCLTREAADTPDATHQIRVQERRLAWPSRMPYLHAELVDLATGRVLSQFDGWYGGPRFDRAEAPDAPRRPMGALARLMVPGGPDGG